MSREEIHVASGPDDASRHGCLGLCLAAFVIACAATFALWVLAGSAGM